jgi:hypothetical protein
VVAPSRVNCQTPARWVAAAHFPAADSRSVADLRRAAALPASAADTPGRQRRAAAARNRVAAVHQVPQAEVRPDHVETGRPQQSAGQFVARAAQSVAAVDVLQ